MRYTAFGEIGIISTDWDWTKVIVDHKTLSDNRERFSDIEFDIDFHHLWGETGKVIPLNWRAVYMYIATDSSPSL